MSLLPPKLHLRIIAEVPDPYEPTSPVSIPLGAGLCATVLDGDTAVTTGDLETLSATASRLWQDAASAMLTTLGDLTAAHGTALRHRDLGDGVREIAVVDEVFPAAGLIAHPLLATPTHRMLSALADYRAPSGSALVVTLDQRLLVTSTGQLPEGHGELLSPPLDMSAGYCREVGLESVP